MKPSKLLHLHYPTLCFIALVWFTNANAETDLNELETLKVEQAQQIVSSHKGTLSFKNLQVVTPEVAKLLGQYKGELRLNGLQQITPEVARFLSNQPKGGNLCLNGLKTITPEVAKALATRQGGMLSLNALTEITPEVANELANVKGKLTLNGLLTLPPEVANGLAKHRSKLTIFALPDLSTEAAKILSEHRGTFLLNGLTRLHSPVLLESMLRKNDGFLKFTKVETMTEEVGVIFANYKGKKQIKMEGLAKLPAGCAKELIANKNLVLPRHLQKPGFRNQRGMQLAYIPSGKFGMGSPKTELKREEQEKRHEVVLTKDFYMGVHEVTVGQFREFIQDSGYVPEAIQDGQGSWGIEATGKIVRDAKYNWKNPGFKQCDENPVVNVSWNDAKAFCKWLSQKEKKTYRLPTEAEWEYACRAGTRTAYSYGDAPQSLLKAGNVADAKARKAFKSWTLGIKGNDGYEYSAPVGQFQPNQFGLFDMHGNVWEWCEDWYDDKGYTGSKEIDPKGPDSGERKVHRGGGWSSASNRCRSASRIGRHYSKYRGCYLGFRVVMEVE